ncbi:hypothetical protein B296_00032280 [Ensete ventricosum]|uniref:Uncharacterized protein n=1 Tax=Ensete ventricosum TaxID=4639 RepID=A0A426Y6S9_ENSVE|nr:hypothetical protein B296_00032280 [Ensete ventricosum]
MDEENTGPFRRTSSRTKKIAAKMAAALASADNRTQVDSVSRAFAALARLESLENDNAGAENMEINDDDDASLDDDDQGYFYFSFARQAWDPGCCYEDVLVEEEVGRGDVWYIPVRQIVGTGGTYRSVRLSVRGPPATGRYRQKSIVSGRLSEKSTVGSRFREKSG